MLKAPFQNSTKGKNNPSPWILYKYSLLSFRFLILFLRYLRYFPKMSLYEMHFVTNAAEQARLKEQQKILLKGLKELSITANLQQQQNFDKTLTRQYLTTNQLHDGDHKASLRLGLWYSHSPAKEVATECRPYTPYSEPSKETRITYFDNRYPGSPTPSSASSISLLLRHRTPSLSSASSSINSDNASCVNESVKENNPTEISER